MDKLFLGLALVLLDLNISFGSIHIDFLPDFLGFFLIAKSCVSLVTCNQHFIKVQTAAKLLTVYSGILFLLNLFGIGTQLGVFSLLLNGIRVICSLITIHWLINGIRQIEQQRTWDLATTALQTMLPILACLHSLSLLLSWIPVIGLLAALAATVVSICFLTAFYKTRQLYAENLQKQHPTIDADAI